MVSKVENTHNLIHNPLSSRKKTVDLLNFPYNLTFFVCVNDMCPCVCVHRHIFVYICIYTQYKNEKNVYNVFIIKMCIIKSVF